MESSKKSFSGNNSIIDDIRRRLKSNSYVNQDFKELDKSNVKQFQDEFSQFYKIPKRIASGNNDYTSFNYGGSSNIGGGGMKSRTMRNLDYDSESRYKSSIKMNNQYSNSIESS